MRRGVIFGVLVMVAGVVLGAILVVSAVLSVTRTIDGFARIGFDEPTDLVFDESGEYTVYFEALDLDPGTEAPIGLSVTRLADGEAVDIERYDGDATYTKDGREGQAAFTIDIPVAGAYRVDANLALDDAGSALAFGRDIGGDLLRSILWGVVLAVIVIALGLAIVVVSIARGSFEPRREGAAATVRSTAPLRQRSGRAPAARTAPPPPRPSSWASLGRVVRDDPRRAVHAARAARQDPRAAAEALLGDDADAVFEQFQQDPEAALDSVLDRVAETAVAAEPPTAEEPAAAPPPPAPSRAVAPPPPGPPPPAPPPAWQTGPEPAAAPEPVEPESAASVAPVGSVVPQMGGLVDAPTSYVPLPVVPPPPTGGLGGPDGPEPGDDSDDGGADEDWQPEDLTPTPRFTPHELTPPPSY